MTDLFVEVQNLSKNFGSFQVLQEVSFQISRGEFFGLLGPNGAGKTTTINLLSGLHQPTQGKIIMDGVDLSLHPRHYKIRLGLVPQDFAFYSSLSAADNLRFFGHLYGLWGRRLQQRVKAVLETVQLLEREKQVVATFSNGMKRRLNIAIALLHQPPLLILDEPTVGVDAHSRNAIFEAIQKLNQEGITIFFTTHIMEEAERFCHRVAIMDQGQIIALDTPQNLINQLSGGMARIVFDQTIDQEFQNRLALIGSFQLIRDREVSMALNGKKKVETLSFILELIQREHLQIKTLNLMDASLETVFLRLTGKQLRD
jgi:ABC-2 type transport system ATP-binding protein